MKPGKKYRTALQILSEVQARTDQPLSRGKNQIVIVDERSYSLQELRQTTEETSVILALETYLLTQQNNSEPRLWLESPCLPVWRTVIRAMCSNAKIHYMYYRDSPHLFTYSESKRRTDKIRQQAYELLSSSYKSYYHFHSNNEYVRSAETFVTWIIERRSRDKPVHTSAFRPYVFKDDDLERLKEQIEKLPEKIRVALKKSYNLTPREEIRETDPERIKRQAQKGIDLLAAAMFIKPRCGLYEEIAAEFEKEVEGLRHKLQGGDVYTDVNKMTALFRPLRVCNLTRRQKNSLSDLGYSVSCLGTLSYLSKKQLESIRNVGTNTIKGIETILHEHGLAFDTPLTEELRNKLAEVYPPDKRNLGLEE